MKKALVVAGLLLIPALFLSKAVKADGTYTPALVVNTTSNQGYLYPVTSTTTLPAAGGFLVNNNGGLFNWSNAFIQSTSAATASQLPALPMLTIAQINALTPATTGQMVMCSNCTGTNVCVSSGSTQVQQFVAISTAGFLAAGCK